MLGSNGFRVARNSYIVLAVESTCVHQSAPFTARSKAVVRRPVHIESSQEFERIGSEYIVEEEILSTYHATKYYPVRIGQTFQERYKTIGKLGFGTASTVWLCRDLRKDDGFVALKVFINSAKYHRELPIHNEINALRSNHEGRKFVRKMYDSFEIDGPHGKHICLALQPLGMSLQELKEVTPDGLFGLDLLRETLRCILSGLQFLHKEVRVIHTDLQASNMLVGIHDLAVLKKYEQYELQDPAPRKELDNRTIYLSRPMSFSKGMPSITDLSEARFGDEKHSDWAMPDLYRAPEVILGIPWSYPVDIWGFAMVVSLSGIFLFIAWNADRKTYLRQLWDLFEPKRLFPTSDENGRYSEAHHLAAMIAIMGPPPLEFLQQSPSKAKQYWTETLVSREWKGLAPIPDITLEREEKRLEGAEKEQFLAYLRKMLQWDPEARGDCEDIYWDEWFLADLIESGEVVRKESISGEAP